MDVQLVHTMQRTKCQLSVKCNQSEGQRVEVKDVNIQEGKKSINTSTKRNMKCYQSTKRQPGRKTLTKIVIIIKNFTREMVTDVS